MGTSPADLPQSAQVSQTQSAGPARRGWPCDHYNERSLQTGSLFFVSSGARSAQSKNALPVQVRSMKQSCWLCSSCRTHPDVLQDRLDTLEGRARLLALVKHALGKCKGGVCPLLNTGQWVWRQEHHASDDGGHNSSCTGQNGSLC